MELYAVILFVLAVSQIADAITCYQCADTKINAVCQTDIEGLALSNRIWSNKTTEDDVVSDNTPDSYLPYIKQCPPQERYCVIERVEDKGLMFAYIRDCSNGVTFSINDVDRFNNTVLNKNNYTTCGFKHQVGLVCITLCEGDMCNGPSIETDSGSSPVVNYLMLLAASLFSGVMV